MLRRRLPPLCPRVHLRRVRAQVGGEGQQEEGPSVPHPSAHSLTAHARSNNRNPISISSTPLPPKKQQHTTGRRPLPPRLGAGPAGVQRAAGPHPALHRAGQAGGSHAGDGRGALWRAGVLCPADGVPRAFFLCVAVCGSGGGVLDGGARTSATLMAIKQTKTHYNAIGNRTCKTTTPLRGRRSSAPSCPSSSGRASRRSATGESVGGLSTHLPTCVLRLF